MTSCNGEWQVSFKPKRSSELLVVSAAVLSDSLSSTNVPSGNIKKIQRKKVILGLHYK